MPLQSSNMLQEYREVSVSHLLKVTKCSLVKLAVVAAAVCKNFGSQVKNGLELYVTNAISPDLYFSYRKLDPGA